MIRQKDSAKGEECAHIIRAQSARAARQRRRRMALCAGVEPDWRAAFAGGWHGQKCISALLGCHPFAGMDPVTGKSLEDCVLIHEGRAAVVAKGVPAGDAELARKAIKLGYRDLVFDAGELGRRCAA